MNEKKSVRAEKEAIVGEIRGQLENSLFVILTDYTGMDVVKTAALRERLSPVSAQFHVVKNSYFSYATRGLPFEGVEESLSGQTAMVFGDGDVVETAKIVRDFAKENQLPVVKVGAMSGVVLSKEDVEQLAGLPSRPQLLGQVVGTIAAPMTGLVGVFQQKLASLVYVLKAAQDKKEAA